MEAKDIKHGMTVSLDGEHWEALDRSPMTKTGPNETWWLHRWNDGVWQTTEAMASSLQLPYVGPRRTPGMLATAIAALETV
jgi:hypothetical protein